MRSELGYFRDDNGTWKMKVYYKGLALLGGTLNLVLAITATYLATSKPAEMAPF